MRRPNAGLFVEFPLSDPVGQRLLALHPKKADPFPRFSADESYIQSYIEPYIQGYIGPCNFGCKVRCKVHGRVVDKILCPVRWLEMHSCSGWITDWSTAPRPDPTLPTTGEKHRGGWGQDAALNIGKKKRAGRASLGGMDGTG